MLHLRPSTPASTHAYVTLRADGNGEGDVPDEDPSEKVEARPRAAVPRTRELVLRCSAPCGFEPLPFGGKNPDVYRVRLGSSDGTALEVHAAV